MDEFEKIKTFSESLVERQQNITNTEPKQAGNIDLPQYLSQFRAVPVQEEKESKRLLWIVLILCIAIVGIVIFALTKRLPEMEETEIVVISPTPTPVKVLPENPGGLNIPDRDKVVYNRSAETAPAPVVESLFPEPEQPVLPEEVIEPENKEEIVMPQVVEEVVTPVSEDVEQLPEVMEVAEEPVVELPIIEDEPQPVEMPVAEVTPESETKPIVAVPQPKPTDVQSDKAATESAKPKITGPIWRAQLLSSASKAKVESSWKTISRQQAALLSDMPYQIISATIPGKGTFWRLQVGEFSTKEMVENLCAKLKKKKQECIPVK